jgi:hypothetical protein
MFYRKNSKVKSCKSLRPVSNITIYPSGQPPAKNDSHHPSCIYRVRYCYMRLSARKGFGTLRNPEFSPRYIQVKNEHL